MSASFPAVTLDEWREKVGEKADAGVPVTPTPDGLEIPWLFVAEDLPTPDPGGTPGLAPFVRGVAPGTAWDVRQEQRLALRSAARAAILADLEGGATSVGIRFDRAVHDGVSLDDDGFSRAVGRGGVAASTVDDLDELLDGVYLDLAPIALHAGASGAGAAALLIALWQRRELDLDTIGGALGIDPLGALAEGGVLYGAPSEALAAAARLCAEADEMLGPAVTVLGVDTAAYAGAGATAAQELAIAVASAAEHLRAGEAAGLDPARVAARLEFTVQGDADQFTGIAKLRALRRMWARVLEACDVEPERRRSRVVSRTSYRMLTAVDPWVNMLRACSAAFAAAVGGADAITVSPLDTPRHATSELGRRVARNTQHVLSDEAHLARVGDPGGGSWYVEWLTDQLARDAWSAMQTIERDGGMVAALQGGALAARIAESASERADAIRHRRIVLTGVNAFPLLGADGVPDADPVDLDELAAREVSRLRARPASDPPPASGDVSLSQLVERAAGGARIDELGGGGDRHRANPLAVVRDSHEFEQLRRRAARVEPPPRILTACVGPVASHNAVATWARNFFEVGGIAAVQSEPLNDGGAARSAARDAGAPLAVVCADGEEDGALVREVVRALHDGGARRVYLAESDDERASAAGADAGVADGVDMVAVLGAALDLCEEPA